VTQVIRLIFKHCHTLINCIVVARRVAYNVHLHLNWYVWMNTILTSYIHVAYIMSHAIEFLLQMIVAKPIISTSEGILLEDQRIMNEHKGCILHVLGLV